MPKENYDAPPTVLIEGKYNKGGLNEAPSTPRPNPPVGQKPQKVASMTSTYEDILSSYTDCSIDDLKERFNGRSINRTAIQQLKEIREYIETVHQYSQPVKDFTKKHQFINASIAYMMEHIFHSKSKVKESSNG